jgi:hypothetical protein
MEFMETLTYVYWFIIKGIIKETNEQQIERWTGQGVRKTLSRNLHMFRYLGNSQNSVFLWRLHYTGMADYILDH